jgi:hypothetical protein
VLGTILFIFIQDVLKGGWRTNGTELQRIVFTFGIVCHYCIDYLYIFSFEFYKTFAFFVDLIVVCALCAASAALTAVPSPDYRVYFACFLVIYLTFLPHELIILFRYKKGGQGELMRAHKWMLIHEAFACSIYLFFVSRPELASSSVAAGSVLLISLDYALILRERIKHHKIV